MGRIAAVFAGFWWEIMGLLVLLVCSTVLLQIGRVAAAFAGFGCEAMVCLHMFL